MLANVFQITHLPQKGTWFRKLTNITFVYLLSPTILQYFKQILKQGCTISAQIGPKLSIVPKRYFLRKLIITLLNLKFNTLLKLPIVFYLTKTFQKKKSMRANHQTRLHNFGQNWAWPCPSKRNLLEKLTKIALLFYIPSCYIISKKY